MPAGLVRLPGSRLPAFLDPTSCISAEKNDAPVRMKEFSAGSKAKTVQLADSKCLVCPLDVQTEKLLPSYDVCACVCVAREQTVGASRRPLASAGSGVGLPEALAKPPHGRQRGQDARAAWHRASPPSTGRPIAHRQRPGGAGPPAPRPRGSDGALQSPSPGEPAVGWRGSAVTHGGGPWHWRARLTVVPTWCLLPFPTLPHHPHCALIPPT